MKMNWNTVTQSHTQWQLHSSSSSHLISERYDPQFVLTTRTRPCFCSSCNLAVKYLDKTCMHSTIYNFRRFNAACCSSTTVLTSRHPCLLTHVIKPTLQIHMLHPAIYISHLSPNATHSTVVCMTLRPDFFIHVVVALLLCAMW